MNKPITKRAQEARMRINGVTPLKQVDATAGTEITEDEKKAVGGDKNPETKPQGTSADDANQTAQGNKTMVTLPKPGSFEARATPKQEARQEVGAQKIKLRGADKLDKIADNQNRKRAGKELKGLKREAMDKKRLDGLTFKERREVGQAFRRGDYKSVLGGEDAKRATQLRGTKKGYTPDDEKPKNKKAEGMAKSYIKGNPATMKPVNIKPVPDLDKKAKPVEDKKAKPVKDKEFIKQNKLENKEARKENKKANKAINKENREAKRADKKAEKASNKIDRNLSKLNERMAVLEGNEAGSTKRAKRYVKRKGREGLRKEEKAAKQEARDQKKLDKAMDQVVKRGLKSSDKFQKQQERKENSPRVQRAITNQVKEELKNDPATARLAKKSPEKVQKILEKDAKQRAKYKRKTEKKREKGKLGPNESLVSPRDKRAKKAYDEAVQKGGETYQDFQPESAPGRIQGMRINNLERKENKQANGAGKMLSSPMKMMGINNGSSPMKKGYFKNK